MWKRLTPERLAARMGFDDPYLQDSDEDIIRKALTSVHPFAKGITFESLKEKGWVRFDVPDGYRPYAEGVFPTASGKCEFYSEALSARGLDPLPGFAPADESPAGSPALSARFPLALVTAKSAFHFLNSSYANMPRQLKAEKEPVADIHPEPTR